MSQPTLFPILPSEKPRKKPVLLGCAIVFALLTVGFFAGRGFQHLKAGHYFKVMDEKSYPFNGGTIQWRYVTDTIGLPFMDPGKTLLEYHDSHGRETTLYKSGVVFQEGAPMARNITIEGNTLRWDDGEFKYTLKMEVMPPEKPAVEPEAKAPEAAP